MLARVGAPVSPLSTCANSCTAIQSHSAASPTPAAALGWYLFRSAWYWSQAGPECAVLELSSTVPARLPICFTCAGDVTAEDITIGPVYPCWRSEIASG